MLLFGLRNLRGLNLTFMKKLYNNYNCQCLNFFLTYFFFSTFCNVFIPSTLLHEMLLKHNNQHTVVALFGHVHLEKLDFESGTFIIFTLEFLNSYLSPSTVRMLH